MRKMAAFAMVFVFVAAMVAVAADAPAKMPKYIWVQTEQYEAGKQAAYMKLGVAFKEAMANTEFTWLAGVPLMGNGNEVTYVTFHDNFASVEKMLAGFMKAGGEMEQKNAALLTEGMASVEHSRSFIAEFEPELSLVSDKISPATTTRWKVVVVQLKPGAGYDFVDVLKEIRAMQRKAGLNTTETVYRMVAGDPNPAYIIITPLKTLADLDEPPLAAFEAMLTPVVKQHLAAVIRSTVADVKSIIYMVEPRLSLPPKNYVAENPAFWTVKAPEPVVVKGKKAKKVVEPAALKEKEKK